MRFASRVFSMHAANWGEQVRSKRKAKGEKTSKVKQNVVSKTYKSGGASGLLFSPVDCAGLLVS